MVLNFFFHTKLMIFKQKSLKNSRKEPHISEIQYSNLKRTLGFYVKYLKIWSKALSVITVMKTELTCSKTNRFYRFASEEYR